MLVGVANPLPSFYVMGGRWGGGGGGGGEGCVEGGKGLVAPASTSCLVASNQIVVSGGRQNFQKGDYE